MSIRLIIFDLDGTLIDAFGPVSESLNYAMQQLGYPQQDQEVIKRSVGWGERKLLARFVRPEDIERIIAIYRSHHVQTLPRGTRFLPGAEELLKRLVLSGYKLAVATNRPQWSSTVILDCLGIRSLFSHMVCGDTIANPKPAPDMLHEILGRLGVISDAAIFVGDMALDMETGNRAGIKTIGVTTGTMTREELQALQPYRIVDTVSEVWDILDRCACGR